MLKEFREFIARGNVIDLAVGVIIGGAFGKIVSSVVNDVVMPPIGLVLGKVNFSDLFLQLGPPKDGAAAAALLAGDHHLTLDEAKKLGIPTLNYGLFINTIIEFIIIAFCVFMLVKGVNRLYKKPPAPKTTEECPFCKEQVPIGAKKCGHCTSTLEAANTV
jgi:large conductance mechanosensitive channel